MTDHLAKAYEEELQRLRSIAIEMGQLTGEGRLKADATKTVTSPTPA